MIRAHFNGDIAPYDFRTAETFLVDAGDYVLYDKNGQPVAIAAREGVAFLEVNPPPEPDHREETTQPPASLGQLLDTGKGNTQPPVPPEQAGEEPSLENT